MVAPITISSSDKGRHSELLAMTALLANGYTVLEPIVAEPFDLAVTKRGNSEIKRVQVKTIVERTRDGIDYYVIRGTRGNGRAYDEHDADYMIGVADGRVFMTENRCLSEYWARKDRVTEKWTELKTEMERC